MSRTYTTDSGIVIKLTDDQSKLFDLIVRVHQTGDALNKHQLASILQWDAGKVDTIAGELVQKGMIGAYKP